MAVYVCHRHKDVYEMLAAFVADLRSTPVVTYQDIAIIKGYITEKHPGLSFERSTLLLADAVRKIVDQKISAISEKYRIPIMENLFRNINRQTAFHINAADVLEAALPIRWAGEELAKEICHWIHRTVKKILPLETLHAFYNQLSERYAKESNQKLDFIAARIDQAYMLKERAAVGREERLKRRQIAQIRLRIESREPKDDAVNLATPIAVFEEKPALDFVVPKTVPAPVQKRAGYLSRRVAVYTTACVMVILALFMMNMVRESIKETAVQASSETVKPMVRVKNPTTSVNDMSNEQSTPGVTGTDFHHTGTVNSMNLSDIGRRSVGADVETKPFGDGRNPEFWADATAYDLSFESCGKTREHPLYGITRSGSRASAGRTIAVDPLVIPLGSKVYITFPENYGYLDGIYIAEDTGRLIKGHRIDLFLGEDLPGNRSVYQDALKFGVQKVKLEILGNQQ